MKSGLLGGMGTNEEMELISFSGVSGGGHPAGRHRTVDCSQSAGRVFKDTGKYEFQSMHDPETRVGKCSVSNGAVQRYA